MAFKDWRLLAGLHQVTSSDFFCDSVLIHRMNYRTVSAIRENRTATGDLSALGSEVLKFQTRAALLTLPISFSYLLYWKDFIWTIHFDHGFFFLPQCLLLLGRYLLLMWLYFQISTSCLLCLGTLPAFVKLFTRDGQSPLITEEGATEFDACPFFRYCQRGPLNLLINAVSE